jgi:hypothetical protein
MDTEDIDDAIETTNTTVESSKKAVQEAPQNESHEGASLTISYILDQGYMAGHSLSS